MTLNKFFSFFILIPVLSLIILSNANMVLAEQEFLIASWNFKDFWGPPSYSNDGIPNPAKLQNFTLVLDGDNYPQVDKKYDIIFVQELKWDKDTSNSKAFDLLCKDYLDDLDYACKSVTGGTFNHEGYGVIYRDGLDVKVNYTGHKLITPHWEQQQSKPKADRTIDKLARPPMMAKVSVDGGVFEFIVFNNHIKPSESLLGINDDYRDTIEERFGSYIPRTSAKYVSFTERELEVLFERIKHTNFETENIIVLGDLNADCSYLRNDLDSYSFVDDDWIVLTPNDTRTNFADNACWYDRIVISDEMRKYDPVMGESIGTYPNTSQEFRFIDSEFGLSDHKLVWAKFTIVDPVIISDDSTLIIIKTPEQSKTLGTYVTLAIIIGGGIVTVIIIIRRNT